MKEEIVAIGESPVAAENDNPIDNLIFITEIHIIILKTTND